MSNKIGVITEQGDLGFGFDPLSKKDQKSYKEATKDQNKSAYQIYKETESKNEK